MPVESLWKSRLIEGLVIVASILIAFWIDAWWAERQTREEVSALVELLIADINADLGELRGFAAHSDETIAAVDRAIAISVGDEGIVDDDRLAGLIPIIWNTAQVDPSLSAFDVVQGSEAWSRLPPAVKVDVSDYMRGPFTVDRDRDLEAVTRLVSLSSEYMDLRSATLSPVHIADYLRDRRVYTWLLSHRVLLDGERRWQRQWVERLPLIADSLREIK